MTLFLSHRGESDDAPENTVEAFKLAMARDSDGWELDIRFTADKQVVVVHDADLKRVANSELIIADSTLAELQVVHPVPLLKDVLTYLKPNKHCQIEIKGNNFEIIPAFRKIFDEWQGDKTQIAISSFEEDTVMKVAEFFPERHRLLLIDLTEKFGCFPTAAETAQLMKSLNCTGVSFKADFKADRNFVNELKKLGMRVVCWGVSSDELGIAMAEAGVDAMTNNHAVALRAKYNTINKL